MIHLILPGLHQNEAWKSFVPTESRRHSREKIMPQKTSFVSLLAAKFARGLFNTGPWGSWVWWGSTVWWCSEMWGEARPWTMLSSWAQGQALSCFCLLRNITSLCWWCPADNAELARVARAGEVTLELPGLKQEWQQEAPHESSRVPSCIHMRRGTLAVILSATIYSSSCWTCLEHWRASAAQLGEPGL